MNRRSLAGSVLLVVLVFGAIAHAQPPPQTVEGWLSELQNPNPVARATAVQRLAGNQEPRVIDALAAALADGDRTVRDAALDALARVQNVSALAPVVDRLLARVTDADAQKRAAAVGLVARIAKSLPSAERGRVIGALAPALTEGGPAPRVAAFDALTRTWDSRLLAPLVEPAMASLTDPDAKVREKAIVFSQIIVPPDRLTPALVALLKHADGATRGSAARTLVNLRGYWKEFPLAQALHDEEAGVRMAAVEGLRGWGTDAPANAQVFVAMLRDPDEDVRSRALDALREMGPRALEPLLAAIGNENATVRAGALSAVSWQRDPRVLTALTNALRDLAPEVRIAAAQALGERRERNALEPLAGLLTDPNPQVRRRAAIAVARLGDARAFTGIIEALTDESATMRQQATLGLGQIDDPQTIAVLIELTKDKDRYVRITAWRALSRLPRPDATGPLLEALASEDAQRHSDAARALQRTNREAMPVVLAALASDNERARQAGAFALADREQLWSFASVAPFLQSRDPLTRAAAAAACAKIHHPRSADVIAPLLDDPDEQVRQQATFALGALRDPRAAAPLFAMIDNPNHDIRSRAASALGSFGTPAYPLAIAGLRSEREYVRANCSNVLSLLAYRHQLPTEAAGPLLAALNDLSPQVREDASSALSMIAAPEHVPALLAALHDASDAVRWDLILALGQTGDPRALDVLLPLAQTTPPPAPDGRMTPLERTQRVAIIALGGIHDERTLEALLGLLRDGNLRYRWVVVQGLAKFADPRAVDAATDLLVDEDRTVRFWAEEALVKMQDPRAWEFARGPSEDAAMLSNRCRWLGMLDDARALDSLLAALRDQSWEVRQAAAEALGQRQSRIAGTGWWGRVRRIAGKMLGQRPDPRVVEALRNTLRDQSPSVRSAAASALQEYRDPESVPLLLAMLHDPDVQTESVLTALGRAGDDRAIEPLIALAEDIVARDPNIERVTHPARVQVLNALRRITGTDLGRDPADWRKWWEAEQAKTP